MHGNATVIDMIVNSGFAAKVVLALLLLFSVFSWGIMIFKLISFRGVAAHNQLFKNIFARNKSLDAIFNASKGMRDNSPLVRVFLAGYTEFESEFRASSTTQPDDGYDQRFFLSKIDGIARSMERETAQEVTRLERFLFFLATTGSTAPFIGLFGTVWGIMESFRAVGLTGAANIAVVAPGIAEALVATAAGLLTAVPAVIGYNYFNHRAKVFGSEMDNFSLDFLSLIEKNFVKR